MNDLILGDTVPKPDPIQPPEWRDVPGHPGIQVNAAGQYRTFIPANEGANLLPNWAIFKPNSSDDGPAEFDDNTAPD